MPQSSFITLSTVRKVISPKAKPPQAHQWLSPKTSPAQVRHMWQLILPDLQPFPAQEKGSRRDRKSTRCN